LRFVDEAKKAGKPFFLYIPHNAPHFPPMAPRTHYEYAAGKAGWDRLRNARYRRQIEMGMIQARWPPARAAGLSAWDSLPPERDRFDQ
jgi:arylsulfatase